MKWFLLLFTAATGFAQSANKCADLAKFQMPGAKIEITRAEMVAAGPAAGGRGRPGPMLPAHCRVNGIVDKRTGQDGKTYGIRFAVALPENWNSDYLQQGGGGLNGTVGEPIGNQATGSTSRRSARGFAVATSDTGHQSSGGGFDGSFMSDQQAALDFEFVAIGRLAVLAKQIIATYYGKPAAHSYYVGCSTGGREAMLMSQRYPLYFDGIVAGSPAHAHGLFESGDARRHRGA